ncbi:VOC family protein [Kitasatospora sp. MAP5-34]|uniref:VOC family protein n=1 Tax=Kitasatospora sp. MAP5-34 TaxID=3035102 RepID=UPI00247632CF|nr:VOC family protein [Kitasatospora sp. MAP5-34]MDH6575669.1 catechol 2,3-dioxygenase-like lactoylglutathione lyase family enzyme [Kitasatospora sp. MAP5-34]
MLTQARVMTMLPAADLGQARGWYQEKLGLAPVEETEGAYFYQVAEGTRFGLYPTPNTNRGGHTQMAFVVADVVAEVAGLRARGVAFEEYDFPGLKTVDGIAELSGGRRAAWFKDCEGNTIGMVQFAG